MNLAARNREMQDFFNEKAEGYDAVHLPMMDNKNRITELLSEGTQRVLDLGAGTGLELLPLFERFPEAQVTVIDISQEMLSQLRKRPFAGRLSILCADFFEADFGEGYDAVISSAALHHFDEGEKENLYARILSCLRPGGIFVNSDRCAHTQEEQDADFAEYAEDPHKYRHMDTALTAENELKILGKVGFGNLGRIVLPDPRYQVTYGYKEDEHHG